MKINGVEYVVGYDRNEDNPTPHLYKGTFDDVGDPMCARGWNRGGESYSIFRNCMDARLTKPVCKVCMRRAEAGLEPVPPRARKTKWL